MKRGGVNQYPTRRRQANVPALVGPADVDFDGFLPDPPRHLDAFAKKVFRRLAAELNTSGILRRVDVEMLGEYCRAVSDVDRLAREIRAKGGEILTGPNGGDYQNPRVSLLEKATKRVAMFGDRLGMNPKLRGAIKFPEGNATVDDADPDQLALFIDGKSWNSPDPDPAAPAASS